MKGFDISVFNGDRIDFRRLKEKYEFDFVLIRAGWSKFNDDCFEVNYSRAKESGLKVGAYWYSYATNFDEMQYESDTCLSVLKDKQLDLPIFCDFEGMHRFKPFVTVANLMDIFFNTVSSTDRQVGIAIDIVSTLTNPDYYKGIAKTMPLWLIDFNKIREVVYADRAKLFDTVSNSIDWKIKLFNQIEITDCDIYGNIINLDMFKE